MLCKLLTKSLHSVRTLWSALERSEMKRNMFSHLLSLVWTWWVKGSHDCWLTLSFLCRTTEADGLTDVVAAGRAAGCQPAPWGLCRLPAALPGFISFLANDRSGKSDQRPMETLQDRTVLNLDRLLWDDGQTSGLLWRLIWADRTRAPPSGLKKILINPEISICSPISISHCFFVAL